MRFVHQAQLVTKLLSPTNGPKLRIQYNTGGNIGLNFVTCEQGFTISPAVLLWFSLVCLLFKSTPMGFACHKIFAEFL